LACEQGANKREHTERWIVLPGVRFGALCRRAESAHAGVSRYELR
jgi:hypothetical protein